MLAKITSFLFNKLGVKCQNISVYFDKTQTDETVWRLRMISFRTWVAITLSLITFLIVIYK
jgi:hypothetical protein